MKCSFALPKSQKNSTCQQSTEHRTVNATTDNSKPPESLTQLSRTIILYASGITIAIAIFVLMAWYHYQSSLGEVIPLLCATKVNTAIGLLVCGLAIFAALQNQMRIVYGAGIFLLLLGGGTMLEYATGMNLGIDELFIKDKWDIDSLYPGRMSPNSAICFIAIATILLIPGKRSKWQWRMILLESMVFVIIATSLVALGEYFTSVDVVYNWGNYAKMAPQSAAAFFSISIGLATLLWHREQTHMMRRLPSWMPTLLCFFVLWFDLSVPQGIVAGIAYIPLIFCSLSFTHPLMPFFFAAVASVLNILGYIYSPPSSQLTWITLTNRALTVGALWFVAIVVYLNRQYNLARKQSEANLRSVVDTVLDGLITIDEIGTIHTFNPASVRIFGYQPEEVIGQNVKMLMPEPYHSEHDGYLHNYMTTGDAKVIGIGREVSARRKNGKIFPMELGINEMRVTGKRMFVGTIRDISERKQAEMEIQQYLAALKRSNQELDDFAYIASHDLKEPLRGLSNNAMFLKEDFEQDIAEEGKKRLARMTYLCERMERLVNDLLYFSRLGRQELAVQQTNLNEVIADIVSMMEMTLHEKNASVIISETLPTITCDLPRITEVFRNLITNAIKYNNKPEKRVEIGCRQLNGERIYFVRDNGIGIAPEFYGDVFRIFKRLNDEDDAIKGTGVGLTFVKKIIERHNGRIWIESTLGECTTFYFTLQEPQGESL